MHRDMRLKIPLQAKVSSVGILPATKTKKSNDPSNTIRDEMEWKRVFHLLRATYSALLVLQLVDSVLPRHTSLICKVEIWRMCLGNGQN
jgi:hypothetical protein